MPNEYIDDFFECVYNAEIEQKQQLDSGDGFIVGILGALIGVGAYFLQLLAKAEFEVATLFLAFFAVPYFLALGGGIWCMVLSIWPRYKEYISSPQQWADYVAGEVAHFGYFHGEPKLSDRVALELRKLRRQQYIQAGEVNRQLIYKKHAYQTWAKRGLIAAVVCMLFSGIPIYFLLLADAAKGLHDDQRSKTINAIPTNPAAPNTPVKPDAKANAPAEPKPDSKTNGAGTSDKPAAAPLRPAAAPGAPDNGSASGGRDPSQKTVKEPIMSEPDSGAKPAAAPAQPPARPTPPATTKVKSTGRTTGDFVTNRGTPTPPVTPPPTPPSSDKK